MNQQKIRVLIVSLPGVLQNVLVQTFETHPEVDLVGIAHGGLSAMALLHDQQPDLIVLNSNLPGSEATALIHQIKAQPKPALCLALVEISRQIKQIASAGADFTLRAFDLPAKMDMVLTDVRTISKIDTNASRSST